MYIKVLVTASLLALACAMQTGCALQLQQQQPRPLPQNHSSETPITRLLSYSRTLMQASPSRRLALLKDAKAAYTRHPGPTTAARLALTYGQPDYTGYAPENGWRYAKKALAAEAHWDPAAATYLRQFAALCVDNDHVRTQLKDTAKQAESTRQQLTRTRRALTRTQQKLHALTQIETQLNP